MNSQLQNAKRQVASKIEVFGAQKVRYLCTEIILFSFINSDFLFFALFFILTKTKRTHTHIQIIFFYLSTYIQGSRDLAAAFNTT